jgi:hypothetical protein
MGDAGPLRRAGLYLGLVSDDPSPAAGYVRGELTRFQLKMTLFYVLIAAAFWIGWWTTGRRTVLELAAFWSLMVLWMASVGLRRARTPRSQDDV